MKPSTPFSLSALIVSVGAAVALLVLLAEASSPSDGAPGSKATSGRSALIRDSNKSDEKSSGGSLARAKEQSGGLWADQSRESLEEPRGMESNIANAKIQVSQKDMATAAGSHHGKSHGKYYMFTEVPKKHSYKMGFKRGNHKHEIERKESVHKSHVHSYFKWHDKKGKGSHKFEFKHEEKKKKHH